MPTVVNVHQAKVHLSRLLERVRQGEEIILAKAGTPVACLVPIGRGAARRTPGSARGQVEIGADFDTPLPDEVLSGFGR